MHAAKNPFVLHEKHAPFSRLRSVPVRKENMMQDEPKKTLLHGWHTAHGANMADFGRYNMPLWYPAGAKQEHLAVLTAAGMFDTSHMAAVLVSGPQSFELLQRCFTRDLNACSGRGKSALTPGNCTYGAFLDENGFVIDDAIVYQLADQSYMVIVNAGMGGPIARHLEAQAGEQAPRILDLSDRLGKFDLQGPRAAAILMRVLENPGKVLDSMRYFTFKGCMDPNARISDAVRMSDSAPVLISRTGYTGEFGFEIFLELEHFIQTWERVLEAGKDFGLLPCGLAARDSLRTGAVLPLSHQDIGRWPFINHPWEFALPFVSRGAGFSKAFIGDQALLNIRSPEYTHAFVGHDLRKVSAHDPAAVLDAGGKKIGEVLTCVTDMGIGRFEDHIYSIASPDKPENFQPKGLSCGFVKTAIRLSPGQTVTLKDNRRKIEVVIVENIRPDRTARMPIHQMMDAGR